MGKKRIKKCKICGKKFTIYFYRINTAQYCSLTCQIISQKGKHSSPKTEFKKGNKPYNYKGITLSNGRFLLPRNGKQQYQYRVLVEKAIGRKLKTLEHIHHIDENKLNDLLENLFVTSNSNHKKIHYYSYNYLVETGQIKEYFKWMLNKYNVKGKYVFEMIKGGGAYDR